jgi:phosphoenolpyruvate-protein kinase (PTS system EI component)
MNQMVISLDSPEATLEVGVQLSHGSIVARGYGVPAVVDVNGATQYIQDDQTITIDGTGGQVYLEVLSAMEETNL